MVCNQAGRLRLGCAERGSLSVIRSPKIPNFFCSFFFFFVYFKPSTIRCITLGITHTHMKRKRHT